MAPHDVDGNCTMPTPLGTDVFDWLAGDGFVMAKPTGRSPQAAMPIEQHDALCVEIDGYAGDLYLVSDYMVETPSDCFEGCERVGLRWVTVKGGEPIRVISYRRADPMPSIADEVRKLEGLLR